MRRLRVLAAALTCACSGGSAAPHARTSPAVTTASYQVGSPVGLAAADGKVWTVSVTDGELTGRAAPSARPDVRVKVGSTPLRTVYDGHLLWVSDFGAGRVVAVDPSTAKVVRRVRVAGQPEGLVAAFGTVWVVRQQAGLLSRISRDGHLGPSYRLGDEPRLVVASDQYLFASNFVSGTVTRIDPRSGARRTSQSLCTGPQDMLVVDDVLWVSCTPEEKVVTLDPRTLHLLGKVEIDGEPDVLRLVDKRLYVLTTNGPTLVQLNAFGNGPAVVNTTALGSAPPLLDQANVDAVFANGRWWVSSPSENKVVVYTP